MTAFLKIDRCTRCCQERSWEFVPPVSVGGRTLAGTGIWRSALLDGLCAACLAGLEAETRSRALEAGRWARLIRVLGAKPAREFTFERFRVTPANRVAVGLAKAFNAAKENLYIWGPPGVGKSHLAFAIARAACWEGAAVIRTTPTQLIRKLRMRPPDEEQHALDAFIGCTVLVIDGLNGDETPYGRQMLLEVLDGRDYSERKGLVITSRWSLPILGRRMGDPSVVARLEAMCLAVEIPPSAPWPAGGTSPKRAG